jgi:hypothetical protein
VNAPPPFVQKTDDRVFEHREIGVAIVVQVRRDDVAGSVRAESGRRRRRRQRDQRRAATSRR